MWAWVWVCVRVGGWVGEWVGEWVVWLGDCESIGKVVCVCAAACM